MDVARHMEVSKPSVSHAVTTLRDGGFLTMDEDYFLHLTGIGREVAEQIYEKPENPFVADFIGSINFIDAKAGAPYGLVKGGTAAVRPEKIELARTGKDGGLKGTITDIEFRGFYDRVSVKVSHVLHGNIVLAVDVPFRTAKTMKFKKGESVYISIPEEEVLQFETA